MNEWEAIDWNKLKDQAEARTSNVKSDLQTFDSSIYFKLQLGNNEFRIIPAGNRVEKMPYKIVNRHELKVMTSKGESTRFPLCWHYITENLAGIKRPLIEAQKLDKEQDGLAKRYGCPICRARQAMWNAKVEKTTCYKLNNRIKYLFNVLNRQDNKVYIYTASEEKGKQLESLLKRFLAKGLNPLDVVSGYDCAIEGTGGNGLSRRYGALSFLPIPCPLIDPRSGLSPDSIVPHDLTKSTMDNFVDYQGTIDLLQQSMGDILAHIEYKIPGDRNDWSNVQAPTQVGTQDVPWNTQFYQGVEPSKVEDSFTQAVPPSKELPKPKPPKPPSLDEIFKGQF